MEGREPATARPAETKSDTFILLTELRTSYQDPGGEPSLSMLSFILCASITSPLVATWKINGVSTLSNIQFSKEGIGPCVKSI